MQQAMGRAFRDLHVLIPEVLIKPFHYFNGLDLVVINTAQIVQSLLAIELIFNYIYGLCMFPLLENVETPMLHEIMRQLPN
jgi:hypothetical protein